MSDITSSNFDWSSRSIKLDNGYLSLTIDLARPRVTALRIDPSGRGRYSPNQLATGFHRRGPATFPDNGALTQYVDAAGVLHSSSEATAARISEEHLVPTTGMLVGANPYSRLGAITIQNIEYGNKRETWTIELPPDTPELIWQIDEHWLQETMITDCRTPVFWFAQRDDWGEPFHFQLLRRGMVFSDPYGGAEATLVSGGYGASRAVLPEERGSIVAKTYARTPVDLRVIGSAHLQRSAVLNWWSYLGQTRIRPRDVSGSGATGSVDSVAASGYAEFEFSLRLTDPESTGTVMRLAAPVRQVPIAKRLFVTHANCAMVANTRDGYLGNEPDGYHATMVSWMQARALLFSSHSGPVSAEPHWTTLGLMRQQLRNIADSTDAAGLVHSGYAAETALDTNPSFALSVADYAVATGDASFVRELLGPVRRALDNSLDRTRVGSGLLTASVGSPDERSDAVIDYWDWLRRPGSVTYPNVLLFHALKRWAAVERWADKERELGGSYLLAAEQLRSRILDVFWDSERGCLAESALDGVRFTHLYTAVQYLSITSGLLDDEKACTVMAAMDARLTELGANWRKAIAMPTNLYDARDLMPRFTPPGDEVVEFGHTMNGGSLLSWAYFEIGSLIAIGRVDDAWTRASAVLERFDATALLEGCNYWDHRGRPSRARLEPFLSDVGLVATALPRWFMGICPDLDRIDLDPALPAEGPWALQFDHLGAPVEIVIHSWLPGERRISVSGASVPLRVLDRGRPLSGEPVTVNRIDLVSSSDGILDLTGAIA